MTATIDAEMVLGLIEMCDLAALQEFSPPGFDWAEPLGENGLPALMQAIVAGLTESKATKVQCLAIVEWLLQVGADPAQRVSDDNGYAHSLYNEEKKATTEIKVEYAGHSSVSLVVAWLRQMRLGRGNAKWSDEQNFLKRVMALVSRSAAAKNPRAADVTVPQSTLDLWESIRDLTSSHNVIFEASDGEVSAHDHVLAVASPVLKAMLESAMKEGTSRRIQVKDSSSSGVSLFLDLLYTSSTREDPGHKTMLAALDLAHRWQVHGVVQTLSVALRGMIDANSFVAIAEAAVLKSLETLVRACASFGSTDKQVQAMLKKGDLPVPVRKLLGNPEQDCGEQRKPKKRRLFRSS